MIWWLLVVAVVGVAISLHPGWKPQAERRDLGTVLVTITADVSKLQEAMVKFGRAVAETEQAVRAWIPRSPDEHRPLRERVVCDGCLERLASGVAPERLHHTVCWEAAILEGE